MLLVSIPGDKKHSAKGKNNRSSDEASKFESIADFDFDCEDQPSGLGKRSADRSSKSKAVSAKMAAATSATKLRNHNGTASSATKQKSTLSVAAVAAREDFSEQRCDFASNDICQCCEWQHNSPD